jgi:ArsR family transcriptional regulator, arsenate/arsenite/antimonite-responsive transcriptional repressor
LEIAYANPYTILALAFKYVKAYMSVMRNLVLLNAALADENRLRLLNLIKGGEICVCHLQGVLQTNQPKISRHLAYLRKAGLVEARQDGRWTHYRLKKLRRNFGNILSGTLNCLRNEPQIKKDIYRLKQITCCPSRFGFASPRVVG